MSYTPGNPGGPGIPIAPGAPSLPKNILMSINNKLLRYHNYKMLKINIFKKICYLWERKY